MPYRERRDLDRTLQCVRCGGDFHPFKRTEQSYCSRACATAYGQERMAALRAEGRDPAHGGVVAEKRRQALARRRASGEHFGRKAPAGGVLTLGDTSAEQAAPPPPRVHRVPPDPQTAEEHVMRDALAYLASGNRHEHRTAQLLRVESAGQTLILAGYGAGLRVERDALIVAEGHTHTPQTPLIHTLYRGVHGIARIVIVGARGQLTFDALAWCREQGITVHLLSRDGGLEATLTPDATADAALRRAQYFAQETGRDVAICQELLRRKLAAQRATVLRLHELSGRARAVDTLDTALAWLALPEVPPWLATVDGLRMYEASAARAYFAAWAGWPLCWGKADAKRVPPHWLAARDRGSPISPGGNARHAVDPLNATRNYAYALLEGQCRQALTALGFDVACGFLHADKAGRDSLVYDLMECERGTVDGLVHDFLGGTTLHYGDCALTTDGGCRLHPQLARTVVAACRVEQRRIDEHARWLREALLAPKSEQARPPLTAPDFRMRKRGGSARR